jgi:hypothetical protein
VISAPCGEKRARLLVRAGVISPAPRSCSVRVLCLLLVVASLGACAQRVPTPPPSTAAAVMDRPASAIPADLDVAIRLDLDAARRLFGPAIGQALKFDIADEADDRGAAALLETAFSHADVIWIGFRPGLAAKLTDNVLVMRGNFAGVDPPFEGKGAFRPSTDLGAGFRLYTRAAPARRSAPSRLYARADDWLVFVSEAEVDGAERAIERRAGDEQVEPPEHGIVSLAARVSPLVPLLAPKYPSVAEALGGAVRLEGVADGDDRGLRATLEIRYQGEADANRGRERLVPLLEALRETKKGPLGRLARGADASVTGPVLVLRVVLDGPSLAALIAGCPRGPGAADGC